MSSKKPGLRYWKKRVGEDATKFLADPAEDAVYSGPYHKFFSDDTKVVLVRDDNYWGQDKSMWGKLPVPKYLAHVIYKDNAAGSIAFGQLEVDVSQEFNSMFRFCGLTTIYPFPPIFPTPLWHWRQPANCLLQPGVTWFGPGRNPQSDRDCG